MLTYSIPKNIDIPIYEFLYRCIKEDILSGRLQPKEKLPSKRLMADQLKISLITVEHAYAMLLTEGYIFSVEKKGYYVEAIHFENGPRNQNVPTSFKHMDVQEMKDLYFPYNTWSKLTRKVLADNISINPTPFNGDFNLRQAIAKHLYEFHELNVSPESIIIGAGSEYLYSLLIQYFGIDNVYALENPGHKNIANIYHLNNAKIEFVDLDKDGLNVEKLMNTNAKIVHISPAHHYPTGITMPLKRRMELLKWAKQNKGYIIEDDYDSEFRINSRPIPPVFQLDNNNCVIYMNTFSKSLSSSFRIAYMVLPNSLIQDFNNKLGFYHNSVSALEQKVLTEFIEDGYFERHLNRKRKIYHQIHDELMNNMNPLLDKYQLKLLESESGLHFIIEHRFNVSDENLNQLFISNKIPCTMLSDYFNKYKETKKIVVNYSSLTLKDIPDFIKKLNSIFKQLGK